MSTPPFSLRIASSHWLKWILISALTCSMSPSCCDQQPCTVVRSSHIHLLGLWLRFLKYLEILSFNTNFTPSQPMVENGSGCVIFRQVLSQQQAFLDVLPSFIQLRWPSIVGSVHSLPQHLCKASILDVPTWVRTSLLETGSPEVMLGIVIGKCTRKALHRRFLRNNKVHSRTGVCRVLKYKPSLPLLLVFVVSMA